MTKTVARHASVDAMLAAGAAVACGISGGKDGQAAAIAVDAHLDAIGHRGPRVLVHSDLGVIEWRDSLPACRRLAVKLGWELLVVSRKAGGMIERWETRWEMNVARYANLECMKVILPWSTPGMRFCTSELKTDVINSALKKRFPDSDIVSVTGIRRDESPGRARKPVCAPVKALRRNGLDGLVWNAICEWTLEDVLELNATSGIPAHEAYRTYGSGRVSCSFCIMGSIPDMKASASCPDNHGNYRRLCALEARSGFGFQGGRWLSDLRPDLLGPEALAAVAAGKRVSTLRDAVQSAIPARLLYDKQGWPTCRPTAEEADLVARIRVKVGGLTGVEVGYASGPEVSRRFDELIERKAAADLSRGLRDIRREARAIAA